MNDFVEEFDTTSSSSSESAGDSSCEAGESELNESQEELNLLPTSVQSSFSTASVLSRGSQPAKRKRLRKRKVAGLRKKLRTHIESVEEFNPEARDAQSAELERIHRLKLLQQMSSSAETAEKIPYSIHDAAPGGMAQSSVGGASMEGAHRVSPESSLAAKGSSSPEIVQVEMGQPTPRDVHPQGARSKSLEAIVIDSGSSDSDNPGSATNNYLQRPVYPRNMPHPQVARNLPGRTQERRSPSEGRQLLRKYDVVNYMRKDGRVLVNVGHAPTEPDVFLAPQIGRVVKSHQVGGIRFLYDNIVESIAQYDSTPGFGCILAHSMGLGKTMQVISFIEVFLRHTSSSCVLCVVPVNTLQNWIAEFNKWLPLPDQVAAAATTADSAPSDNKVAPRSFDLFALTESNKTMAGRYKVIQEWHQAGGVLLIGYEMFRLLSLSVPSLGGNKMATKRKKSVPLAATSSTSATIDLDQNEKEMDTLITIQQALCDPGPDLVVCDEGHRIKNDYSNISQALKTIHTKRRIVMTGYPLQNNLIEYWCMVDFVRPKYLGTKQEFADLFERPINNGQCMDSSSKDVQLMRHRSHVLHSLLDGFVLRRGHEILVDSLPPKYEHTLLLRPSPVQGALYNYSIEQIRSGPGTSSAGPLKAFAMCSKIWNHPDIYYNEVVAQESKRESPVPWSDESGKPGGSKTGSTGVGSESSMKLEWPTSSLPHYSPNNIQNSPKMVVLLELIFRSVKVGEKVLVFSQSLATLSYVEKLLSQCHIPVPLSSGERVEFSDSKWVKGKNFCRLDGSTNSIERDKLIGQFNSPENDRCWVFLLSTKAGCLGINLIGANRVVVLDVSWNPCHDAQAVCRVYRYGQTKPSHIYRLVCDGTMERKIYDRQISKQGMANRVVDELAPERHLTVNDIITLMAPLAQLPDPQDFRPYASNYSFDPVLVDLCNNSGHLFTKLPFKHESLLLDSAEERMTEREKGIAIQTFHHDLRVLRGSARPTLPPHTVVNPMKQQQQHPGVKLEPQSSHSPGHVPSQTSGQMQSQVPGQISGQISTQPSALIPGQPHNQIPGHPSSVSYHAPSSSHPPQGQMVSEVICLDSSSEEEEEESQDGEDEAEGIPNTSVDHFPPLLNQVTQEIFDRTQATNKNQSAGSVSAIGSSIPPPAHSTSKFDLTSSQLDGLPPLYHSSNEQLIGFEDLLNDIDSIPSPQLTFQDTVQPSLEPFIEGLLGQDSSESASNSDASIASLMTENTTTSDTPSSTAAVCPSSSSVATTSEHVPPYLNKTIVPLTSPESSSAEAVSGAFPHIPLLSPVAARLLYLSTGTSLPSSPPEDVHKYFAITSKQETSSLATTSAVSSQSSASAGTIVTPREVEKPADKQVENNTGGSSHVSGHEDNLCDANEKDDKVVPMMCSPLPQIVASTESPVTQGNNNNLVLKSLSSGGVCKEVSAMPPIASSRSPTHVKQPASTTLVQCGSSAGPIVSPFVTSRRFSTGDVPPLRHHPVMTPTITVTPPKESDSASLQSIGDVSSGRAPSVTTSKCFSSEATSSRGAQQQMKFSFPVFQSSSVGSGRNTNDVSSDVQRTLAPGPDNGLLSHMLSTSSIRSTESYEEKKQTPTSTPSPTQSLASETVSMDYHSHQGRLMSAPNSCTDVNLVASHSSNSRPTILSPIQIQSQSMLSGLDRNKEVTTSPSYKHPGPILNAGCSVGATVSRSYSNRAATCGEISSVCIPSFDDIIKYHMSATSRPKYSPTQTCPTSILSSNVVCSSSDEPPRQRKLSGCDSFGAGSDCAPTTTRNQRHSYLQDGFAKADVANKTQTLQKLIPPLHIETSSLRHSPSLSHSPQPLHETSPSLSSQQEIPFSVSSSLVTTSVLLPTTQSSPTVFSPRSVLVPRVSPIHCAKPLARNSNLTPEQSLHTSSPARTSPFLVPKTSPILCTSPTLRNSPTLKYSPTLPQQTRSLSPMTSPHARACSPAISPTLSANCSGRNCSTPQPASDIAPRSSEVIHSLPIALPTWTSPVSSLSGYVSHSNAASMLLSAVTTVSPICNTTSAFVPVMPKNYDMLHSQGHGGRISCHLSHSNAEAGNVSNSNNEHAGLTSKRKTCSTATSITSEAELGSANHTITSPVNFGSTKPAITSFKCHEPVKLSDLVPSVDVKRVPITLISSDDSRCQQFCSINRGNAWDSSTNMSDDISFNAATKSSTDRQKSEPSGSRVTSPTFSNALSHHSEMLQQTDGNYVSQPTGGVANITKFDHSQASSSLTLSSRRSLPENDKTLYVSSLSEPNPLRSRSSIHKIKTEMGDTSMRSAEVFQNINESQESLAILEDKLAIRKKADYALLRQYPTNPLRTRYLSCSQDNTTEGSSPSVPAEVSQCKAYKRPRLFSAGRENVFQFSSSQISNESANALSMSGVIEKNCSKGGAGEQLAHPTPSSNSQHLLSPQSNCGTIHRFSPIPFSNCREDPQPSWSHSLVSRPSCSAKGNGSFRRFSFDTAAEETPERNNNLVFHHEEQHIQKTTHPPEISGNQNTVDVNSSLSTMKFRKFSSGDRCEDCVTSGLRPNCTKCFRLKILGRSESQSKHNSSQVGFFSSHTDESWLATHPVKLSDDAMKHHHSASKFREHVTKKLEVREGQLDNQKLLHRPPISCRNKAVNDMVLSLTEESDMEDELYEEDPIPKIKLHNCLREDKVDCDSKVCNYSELMGSTSHKPTVTQHDVGHRSDGGLKPIRGDTSYNNSPQLWAKSPEYMTGSTYPIVANRSGSQSDECGKNRGYSSEVNSHLMLSGMSRDESEKSYGIRHYQYGQEYAKDWDRLEAQVKKQSCTPELCVSEKHVGVARHEYSHLKNTSTILPTSRPSQCNIRMLDNGKQVVRSNTTSQATINETPSNGYSSSGQTSTHNMTSKGKFVVGGIQCISGKDRYRRHSFDSNVISPTPSSCAYQPAALRSPNYTTYPSLTEQESEPKNKGTESINVYTAGNNFVVDPQCKSREAAHSTPLRVRNSYQSLLSPPHNPCIKSSISSGIGMAPNISILPRHGNPAVEVTTTASSKEDELKPPLFSYSNKEEPSVINDLTPTASEQLQQILNSAQEFIRKEEILRTSKSLSNYLTSVTMSHCGTTNQESNKSQAKGDDCSTNTVFCSTDTEKFVENIDVVNQQTGSCIGLHSSGQRINNVGTAFATQNEIDSKLSQRRSPSISPLPGQFRNQGDVSANCSPNSSPSLCRKTAVVAPYRKGMQQEALHHQLRTPTPTSSNSRHSSPPSLTLMMPPPSSSPVPSVSSSVVPVTNRLISIASAMPSMSSGFRKSPKLTLSSVTAAAPSFIPAFSMGLPPSISPYRSSMASPVHSRYELSPTLLPVSLSSRSSTPARDRSSTSSVWSDEVFDSPPPSATEEHISGIASLPSHPRQLCSADQVLSYTAVSRSSSQVDYNIRPVTQSELYSNLELRQNGKLSSVMTAQVFSGQPCQGRNIGSNTYVHAHHSNNNCWESAQKQLKKETSGYY